MSNANNNRASGPNFTPPPKLTPVFNSAAGSMAPKKVDVPQPRLVPKNGNIPARQNAPATPKLSPMQANVHARVQVAKVQSGAAQANVSKAMGQQKVAQNNQHAAMAQAKKIGSNPPPKLTPIYNKAATHKR
jgi:hypothetical protein